MTGEISSAARRVRLWEWAFAHPTAAVLAITTLAHVLAVTVLGPLRPGVAVPDEQQYLGLAGYVADGRGAEAWTPGYGQSLFDSTATFMWPLTAMTWTFGQHQLNGQLIAAVCGIAVAALTVRLALEVVPRGPALLAGLTVGLLPSQVFWSSVALRESMVWTCLIILALLLAVAGRTRSRFRLGLVALAMTVTLFGLSHLRAQTALVAALALMGAALCFRSAHRWLVPLTAVSIAVLAPYMGGLGPAGFSVVERALPQAAVIRGNLSLDANTSIVDTVPLPPPGREVEREDPTTARPTLEPGRKRPTLEPGRTSPDSAAAPPAPVQPPPGSTVITGADGQQYVVEDSGGVSLRNMPRGLVAVALRPFPWEPATSSAMSLARFEVLAWGPLYLLALLGALTGWHHRRTLAFPFAVGTGILLLSAVTQGNLGTAFRHRAQVLWILAVLAAVGVHYLWKRYRTT